MSLLTNAWETNEECRICPDGEGWVLSQRQPCCLPSFGICLLFRGRSPSMTCLHRCLFWANSKPFHWSGLSWARGDLSKRIYFFFSPGRALWFVFVCTFCLCFFFFHNIFQVQQGLVPEKHAALKHFREHGIYMPPWSYSKEWSQAARLVLQACAFWTTAIPQPVWGTMERLHPGEHLDWRVFT